MSGIDVLYIQENVDGITMGIYLSHKLEYTSTIIGDIEKRSYLRYDQRKL